MKALASFIYSLIRLGWSAIRMYADEISAVFKSFHTANDLTFSSSDNPIDTRNITIESPESPVTTRDKRYNTRQIDSAFSNSSFYNRKLPNPFPFAVADYQAVKRKMVGVKRVRSIKEQKCFRNILVPTKRSRNVGSSAKSGFLTTMIPFSSKSKISKVSYDHPQNPNRISFSLSKIPVKRNTQVSRKGQSTLMKVAISSEQFPKVAVSPRRCNELKQIEAQKQSIATDDFSLYNYRRKTVFTQSHCEGQEIHTQKYDDPDRRSVQGPIMKIITSDPICRTFPETVSQVPKKRSKSERRECKDASETMNERKILQPRKGIPYEKVPSNAHESKSMRSHLKWRIPITAWTVVDERLERCENRNPSLHSSKRTSIDSVLKLTRKKSRASNPTTKISTSASRNFGRLTSNSKKRTPCIFSSKTTDHSCERKQESRDRNRTDSLHRLAKTLETNPKNQNHSTQASVRVTRSKQPLRIMQRKRSANAGSTKAKKKAKASPYWSKVPDDVDGNSDLELVVMYHHPSEGEIEAIYSIHKAIVCRDCWYFDRSCHGGFLESQHQKTTISLPRKFCESGLLSLHHVEALLEWFYLKRLTRDYSLLMGIFWLSDYLLIDSLKFEVQALIRSRLRSSEKKVTDASSCALAFFYNHATIVDCSEIVDSVVDICARHPLYMTTKFQLIEIVKDTKFWKAVLAKVTSVRRLRSTSETLKVLKQSISDFAERNPNVVSSHEFQVLLSQLHCS